MRRSSTSRTIELGPARNALAQQDGLIHKGPCWLIGAEFASGSMFDTVAWLCDDIAGAADIKIYVRLKPYKTVPLRLRKAIRFERGLYYKTLFFATATLRYVPD